MRAFFEPFFTSGHMIFEMLPNKRSWAPFTVDRCELTVLFVGLLVSLLECLETSLVWTFYLLQWALPAMLDILFVTYILNQTLNTSSQPESRLGHLKLSLDNKLITIGTGLFKTKFLQSGHSLGFVTIQLSMQVLQKWFRQFPQALGLLKILWQIGHLRFSYSMFVGVRSSIGMTSSLSIKIL